MKKLLNTSDDDLVPCYRSDDVATNKESLRQMFDSSEQERELDAVVEQYKSMAPARGASSPVSFAHLTR